MRILTSDEAMTVFERYIEGFNGDLSKGTAHEWTPFRFCSDDWVLATAVVRANRSRYEVALFACEDHMDFEPYAGLKAALSFMLADAFHKTGTMGVSFCGPRRGEEAGMARGFCQGVPEVIRRYARSIGVNLPEGRHIDGLVGEQLYQRMVGLNAKLARSLEARFVDPTRTAFLLHRGVVALESLSLIAAHSSNPRSLLEGKLVPENWLRFKRELLLMRRALFAERVRIVFEQGVADEYGDVLVRWEDANTIEVTSSCSVQIETLTSGTQVLEQGQKVSVLLCPLDQNELQRMTRAGTVEETATRQRFIAVARDFSWQTADQQKRWLTAAKQHGFEVLQLFEPMDEIDSEVLLRLERFATTRMMIEECKE